MKCHICKRKASEYPIVLYRLNEKGVPGIFICNDCKKSTGGKAP